MNIEAVSVENPSTIAETAHGRSLLSVWTRRLLRNPQARIAVGGLALLLLLATVGSLVAQDPYAQDAARRFMPPSREHPFGTDELRRDLFSRTVTGLRTSLAISIGAVGLGA